MTDDERALPREAVERAVAAMRPDWRVQNATLADDGHLAVYHLGVAVDGSDEGCRSGVGVDACGAAAPGRAVLKATPPGSDFDGVHAEPRLLALVAARTSIPVPHVYGVVDAGEGLPTPCFLMSHVDGDGHVPDHGTLADDALVRFSRTTGRYLGELHELDVVERFGTVAWTGGRSLDGGTPAPNAAALEVVDGAAAWPAVVADWVDLECSELADTRFGDGVDAWRASLDARVDALRTARDRGDLAFEPVLARIDHGLHNVVLADDVGAVAGVIDWAFTLATTAAYDLAVVAEVLNGGLLAHRDDHPNRRDRVEEALLDGYRAERGQVPAEYRDHGECYELLAAVRGMNHLPVVLDGEPEAVRDAVARGLRERADRLA